jgi:hypothetical protein
MSFVNQDVQNSKNPVVFPPAFSKTVISDDNRIIVSALNSILAALGGGVTVLSNAEEIRFTNAGGVQSPTFNPSSFSVLNQLANTGVLEVVIVTSAGDKTFVVEVGDTLTLPYVDGVTYEVDSLTNAGETEGIYYSTLYA